MNDEVMIRTIFHSTNQVRESQGHLISAVQARFDTKDMLFKTSFLSPEHQEVGNCVPFRAKVLIKFQQIRILGT